MEGLLIRLLDLNKGQVSGQQDVQHIDGGDGLGTGCYPQRTPGSSVSRPSDGAMGTHHVGAFQHTVATADRSLERVAFAAAKLPVQVKDEGDEETPGPPSPATKGGGWGKRHELYMVNIGQEKIKCRSWNPPSSQSLGWRAIGGGGTLGFRPLGVGGSKMISSSTVGSSLLMALWGHSRISTCVMGQLRK